MQTNTMTNPDGCPAVGAMTSTERKQRSVARLSILAEMSLECICQMADNEADDATRAELIRHGTNVGESMRAAMA